MDNDFCEHLIAYLAKLEVEIQALRFALLQADEPLVTEDQMATFRGLAGSKADLIAALIRQEFGFPPLRGQSR